MALTVKDTGIGFAIPINMAREIAPQLQRRGHVTRGLLGVMIQDVTPELARSLGIGAAKGALVSQALPGEPADKAGIKQGDVIVKFDGLKVENSKDLPRIVVAIPAFFHFLRAAEEAGRVPAAYQLPGIFIQA